MRFSEQTGRVRTIYANRGGKVPGIDLTVIDRVAARSDTAMQALLEAYAKKRIRVLLDQLGLRNPDLHDLVFHDFRQEPGEEIVRGLVQGDEIVEVSTTSRTSRRPLGISIRHCFGKTILPNQTSTSSPFPI